ncbi:MAG: hypothetical protein J6Q61_08135 [Bacteroidales bacterium]|nr:hypothetical protein [Bacteroidales bacterium]
MKKLTLSIALLAIALLGNNNCLNAQDAFFDSKAGNSSKTYRSSEEVALPLLPVANTHEDQGAPIGSGLAILTGLGLGYIAFRKKD